MEDHPPNPIANGMKSLSLFWEGCRWAGAAEAALTLPRNVPVNGSLPCSWCHLGSTGHVPWVGRWREMTLNLSQKDCCLERVLCWKEACPSAWPCRLSPGLWNDTGIPPARLKLAGSCPPAWQGSCPPAWQRAFLAAAALILQQLSSCTAKKEHPTKPTLN